MSILVVHLLPQGLLFGADRNITTWTVLGDQTIMETVSGQSQRPKVLKWPNREVIVGYVGAARIDHRPTDQWLYGFIGRNLEPPDLATLAEQLANELNEVLHLGGVRGALTIHLGGFVQDRGAWAPRIYFIHNTAGLTAAGHPIATDMFSCSEEITREIYFGDTHPDAIRQNLRQGHLFSFRQGTNLAAFNVIDERLRQAMGDIIINHPTGAQTPPASLGDWSKHLAFAIHGYAAYFAAFHEPFDQLVGGGVDVVEASWPDT